MDGAEHFAQNQLINVKGNRATMAELVNLVRDGFDVHVLKDSLDQIVALMLTNVHHNHV